MTDLPAQARSARTIAGLLAELELVADPHVRALTRDLVAELLDVHGDGLARLLELIHDRGGPARGAIMQAVLTDTRTSALLVLHELHPVARDVRVARAMDDVARRVGPLADHLSLERVEGDTVIITVDGPAATPQGRVGLTAALERALASHAPDVDRIELVEAVQGRRRLPVLS